MGPSRPSLEPRTIIIGCGVAGIAVSVNLKKRLGYHNFVIYEREKSIGGTWYLNTYPGVGCDVDSHLYSFSFNLNPNWSRRFAEQNEILRYLEVTAEKFDVLSHVRTGVEVVKAEWVEDGPYWRVTLFDLVAGHTFSREAEILISCVGSISIPAQCKIPGHEKFQGQMWHSARWNHNVDLEGKRVGVVGNGCSAAQLVPAIASKATQIIQFQRSPQWINERPNHEFSNFQKWCFRYIPGWNQLYRFLLWKQTDALHHLYLSDTKASIHDRERATEHAVQYMKRTAPKKYWDILIPTFPLGCKRRIFDPGYLECLHRPNVELTTEPILEITDTGIRSSSQEVPLDVIVLATGFKIQEFLSPIEIVGRRGITLNQHWKETLGAQAYKGTFVSGFPNFGIVFGPNAFPAHNSVIYTNEVQAEFIMKTVVKPILRGDFSVIDIKEAAEMRDALYTQSKLRSMVWHGGCANWNLDSNGRNTTNYYDYTWKFWYRLYWPIWEDFDIKGGNETLPMHPVLRTVLSATMIAGLSLGASALFLYRQGCMGIMMKLGGRNGWN